MTLRIGVDLGGPKVAEFRSRVGTTTRAEFERSDWLISPDLNAKMKPHWTEPMIATPDRVAAFFKGEVAKWARALCGKGGCPFRSGKRPERQEAAK